MAGDLAHQILVVRNVKELDDDVNQNHLEFHRAVTEKSVVTRWGVICSQTYDDRSFQREDATWDVQVVLFGDSLMGGVWWNRHVIVTSEDLPEGIEPDSELKELWDVWTTADHTQKLELILSKLARWPWPKEVVAA